VRHMFAQPAEYSCVILLASILSSYRLESVEWIGYVLTRHGRYSSLKENYAYDPRPEWPRTSEYAVNLSSRPQLHEVCAGTVIQEFCVMLLPRCSAHMAQGRHTHIYYTFRSQFFALSRIPLSCIQDLAFPPHRRLGLNIE